jgi:hypothetical protein
MGMNLRLGSFGIGKGPVVLLRRWYNNKLAVSVKLVVGLGDLDIIINDFAPWGLSIRQKCWTSSFFELPIPIASSCDCMFVHCTPSGYIRNQSRESVSDNYTNIFVKKDLVEMSCLLISGYQHNGRASCVHVLPGYGKSRFLRNVGKYPPGHRASNPRIQLSLYSRSQNLESYKVVIKLTKFYVTSLIKGTWDVVKRIHKFCFCSKQVWNSYFISLTACRTGTIQNCY